MDSHYVKYLQFVGMNNDLEKKEKNNNDNSNNDGKNVDCASIVVKRLRWTVSNDDFLQLYGGGAIIIYTCK